MAARELYRVLWRVFTCSPCSDSMAGLLVSPLSLTYSDMHIEHFWSSFSSVVIPTGDEVWRKSSTWLRENWVPLLFIPSCSGMWPKNCPTISRKGMAQIRSGLSVSSVVCPGFARIRISPLAWSGAGCWSSSCVNNAISSHSWSNC